MKKLLFLLPILLISGCGQTKFGSGFYSPNAVNTITASATPVGGDGAIQFATGGLFNSNTNLYWDNLNKRLGVGTTTPGSSLTVGIGDIYISSSTRGLIFKTASNTCFRITVDTGGNPNSGSVTCPS